MTRVQLIDELALRDHFHLTEDDQCYFYGEYTARQGFAFSQTNQLISNLKKDMSRRGMPDWQYKNAAIQQVARIFRTQINQDSLRSMTLVPMPPSKARNDPNYDDRMLQILQLIGNGLDIRELLLMSQSVQASHLADVRPTPDELYEVMRVDTTLTSPAPTTIMLVDDVLTAGAHFCAAKRRLLETFPDAQIVGLFVARRVPESIDWDVIGDL